jgi:hypothetical protein
MIRIDLRTTRLCAALIGLALILSGSQASAQQTNSDSYGYKDPGTATLFSVLITGGGQMYAGNLKKGATLLAIGYGSAIAGWTASYASCDYSCSLAPAAIGGLVSLGTWVYGIMDASSEARSYNTRHGLKALAQPVIAPLPGGRTGVGVSLGF